MFSLEIEETCLGALKALLSVGHSFTRRAMLMYNPPYLLRMKWTHLRKPCSRLLLVLKTLSFQPAAIQFLFWGKLPDVKGHVFCFVLFFSGDCDDVQHGPPAPAASARGFASFSMQLMTQFEAARLTAGSHLQGQHRLSAPAQLVRANS